jgi:hypothetical protein
VCWRRIRKKFDLDSKQNWGRAVNPLAENSGASSEAVSVPHLYIVVNCKTARCEAVHVLRYLGEKGKVPPRIEYWIPYPLLIDCPICGSTYDYSDSEASFRQQELPVGPPPGHFDWLAGSVQRNEFIH